ncbi:MAG: arginine deiminase family protein [Acidobacteriota bacterium]|jgi:dimethylargininase
MVKNEGDRLTRVVVCTPREQYFSWSDPNAHNIHEVADPTRTRDQHDELKTLLGKSGCEVIDVPELLKHPNSVFTRDAALCTPAGFIRLRMGLASRRGEDEWMASILRSLSEPCVGKIDEPGTVEGGDVILAGGTAFVGLSARTNAEGARQISALLRNLGYEVRAAPVPDAHLHLGGGMSVLGPKRVLCCRSEFPDDWFAGFDVIQVAHRDSGTGNVICLAEDEVVADSSGRGDTLRELEKSGVKVHGMDLSEFRKGAGGPTCLILPVERKSSPGIKRGAWD